MVILWKFPWKVSRQSGTTCIELKIPGIPGILGGKSNWTEIPGKTFLKNLVYLASLTSFPKNLESTNVSKGHIHFLLCPRGSK